MHLHFVINKDLVHNNVIWHWWRKQHWYLLKLLIINLFSRFITHKTKALKDTIKCCILVMLFLISFYPPTTQHHWFILIYFAYSMSGSTFSNFRFWSRKTQCDKYVRFSPQACLANKITIICICTLIWTCEWMNVKFFGHTKRPSILQRLMCSKLWVWERGLSCML